jgi:hypothetical protein
MTTYANIKLGEVFALYGNPFSRGTCKKNIKAKLLRKYLKKINFEDTIKDGINNKEYIEDISKIDFLNKRDDGILSLNHFFNDRNNRSVSYIKFSHLFPKNSSSKIQLNTDVFSVSSYKKRTQQELVKRTVANFTSEEINTKLSSIFPKKIIQGNVSHISHNSQYDNNDNI